jgi:hypothetical protein
VHHIGLTRQEIEHLQFLIARLDAQSPGDFEDQRAFPRIDFSKPMWINLPSHPGKPWVHIYSRNLSTGGLSFLTRNHFLPSQHLVISHELNELMPLLVLCHVCFTRPIDLGIHEVGLAFVHSIADPTRARNIPLDWSQLVLQGDWQARQQAIAATS